MTYTSESIFFIESQSISKPPYFNGANYSYWKTMMMLLMQENNLAIWGIIMDGPSILSKQEGELLRLNKGGEEEKVTKRNVDINLKSTTKEYSESSEEVDEGKEMNMFSSRLKRFMNPNKGRRFQKMEELKLESTKEKDLIICYECNNTSSLIVINGRRRDKEVVNLCLMAINDSKVASNSFISNSYSFDELQDAYDELGLEFETMVSKYKKTISKLKDENNSLSKANHELESKIHGMQAILNDLEKKN
ncbi:hypothetical protein V6Z12_D01G136200 [Gossypium hirsutum]